MKLTIYRDRDGIITMIKIGDYVFDVDEIVEKQLWPDRIKVGKPSIGDYFIQYSDNDFLDK